MQVTETYRKDGAGRLHVRVVKTQEDIHGAVFTVADIEKEVNHERQLRRLRQALKEVRDELGELQTERERLVGKIAAIETARDS
jgi:predicted  nucleic acid-binding Zn-ribbon protein